MGVLTCYIPSFPLALLARGEPDVLTHPVALLTPTERVLDASASARQGGVAVGQTARQARIACPDVDRRPADLLACEREFEALLALLDEYSNAVEPSEVGQAYLDLPSLRDADTTMVCQEVGRRIRHEFGAALTPALGCNHSKFTAQAAARHIHPGMMRVVKQTEQRPFLAPLSVKLLPFDTELLRRLTFLGIQRLGQYADLSTRAVFQQFGRTGTLAHQWARGEDTRPIVPRQKRPTITVADTFDDPLDAVPALLGSAIRLLQKPLEELQQTFRGLRRLTATRTYRSGQLETDTWTLPVPTANAQRLQRLLAARWQVRAWPEAVIGLTITISEIQEVWGEQYSLFEQVEADTRGENLLAHLALRYGPGRVHQATLWSHQDGRVEQRIVWREVASHVVA